VNPNLRLVAPALGFQVEMELETMFLAKEFGFKK
jgi:hypothetical protein